MSLADKVKDALKEAEDRGGSLHEQILRYRKFNAELAQAGVVPRKDTYDIPLMSRLRRRSDAQAKG